MMLKKYLISVGKLFNKIKPRNKKMNKQKILIISLIIIVLALATYFVIDMFGKYKNSVLLQGYSVAVQELMTSAENENCEPFSVYFENKTINLINVDCLYKDNAEGGSEVEE